MHLAIIMDGNRRWGKSNCMSLHDSYQKGAENLIKMTIEAAKMGIKEFTVFAFSLDNLSRSEIEKNIINSLLEDYVQNKLHVLVENQIIFKMIGNDIFLSKSVSEKIKKIELATENFNKITLNLCFYYTGKWDIINAIKKIQDLNLKDQSKNITEENITKNLLIKDIDLCIRTGSEKRISNFALWQLSYTELFFSDTLWPDFSKNELKEILEKYKERNRRFGF